MEAIPFVFCKTYEQRLAELTNILYNQNKSLAFPIKIKDLWTAYLEFHVEAVGWQALWKISRDICAELKLKFPTNVVVLVEGVDYKELTANFTVTNVEDAIDIPERFHEVPLIELFPIVAQGDQKVISLESTAEAIDHLRIFYCYLFYPWETEDDETNWVVEHLENRLRLHYDMISYKILHETADQLTNLITKGKKIFKKMKTLEEIVVEMEDSSSNGRNTLQLCELHNELEDVKNQLFIFDKPTLRDLKMKENRAKLNKLRQNHKHFALVAIVGGTSEELVKCFTEVKLILDPETFLRPLHSIQQALNELIPDETVLVGPGVHYLYNSRGLQEHGVVLKGIMGASQCIITDAEDNWALFDLRETDVKFDDLTIQSSRVQYMVVVRQGVCRLNNVVLQGFHSAVGVIVHCGATLYATRCNFASCAIGLVANPGSIVIVTECTFSKNKVAVEVQENSDVMMEGCTIADSEEYALQLDQSEMPCKEGSLDLLSVSGSINVTDLKLVHNFGDVLLKHVEPLNLENINKSNISHL